MKNFILCAVNLPLAFEIMRFDIGINVIFKVQLALKAFLSKILKTTKNVHGNIPEIPLLNM